MADGLHLRRGHPAVTLGHNSTDGSKFEFWPEITFGEIPITTELLHLRGHSLNEGGTGTEGGLNYHSQGCEKAASKLRQKW